MRFLGEREWARRGPHTTYVGLTDDPEGAFAAHREPSDWRVVATFTEETRARAWQESMADLPGCTGGPGRVGWRFGYMYTMTPNTRET